MKNVKKVFINAFLVIGLILLLSTNSLAAVVENSDDFKKMQDDAQNTIISEGLNLYKLIREKENLLADYRTCLKTVKQSSQDANQKNLGTALANYSNYTASDLYKNEVDITKMGVSIDKIKNAMIVVATIQQDEGKTMNRQTIMNWLNSYLKEGLDNSLKMTEWLLYLSESEASFSAVGDVVNHIKDLGYWDNKITDKDLHDRCTNIIYYIRDNGLGDYTTVDLIEYKEKLGKYSDQYSEEYDKNDVDDPEITITPITSPLDNPLAYQPGKLEDNTAITNKAKQVIGIINAIGIIVAVIALIIIGIKYMIAGVQEKAKYKETLVPYVVGVIMLGAGTTLVNLLYNLGMELWK